MRVLLVNPRIGGGRPWIPLGLAYVAAYLRKYGKDVRIFDSNFYGEERLNCLIKDFKPEIVGIGGMTVQCNDAVRIGKLVKRIDKDTTTVYGGVHFTFVPQDGLRFGDICVIGEAEQTFLEICEQRDLHGIRGIAFKESSGMMVFTPERELMPNLDEIPFPAYDLLEMKKYSDTLITGDRAVSLMTGRGCPYNCVFCASPQFWRRKVRFHSIDYVMSHIEFLIERHSLRNLRIMDDTFTLSKERVLQFCDMIEEHKFELNITCLANVRNADLEMFKRMKEVGFSIIAFGVESGNNDILKMINKEVRLEHISSAVTLAKKAGLKTELLFMIGNIGENRNTVVESINLAKTLNPPINDFGRSSAIFNWFQFATPFPGSRFFEIAGCHGSVKSEDWDAYDHQRPVFVPWDLDEKTMVRLREKALMETNSAWYRMERFSWLPQLVRRNFCVRKAYHCLRNALGDS